LPTDAFVIARRSCCLIAAIAFATAGCKSETSKQIDQLDASISWIATVDAVARSWTENRVPTRYAERTMEEASSALHSAKQTRAARIASEMADVVRVRDRAEMDVHLEALREEKSALKSRLEELKHAQ
jgi:hypothetical protein